MRDLDQKRVLVSGAARGIGKHTATAFAARGANVIIADLDPDAAQATAEEIRAKGHSAGHAPLDVTDDDSIAQLRETVHSAGGPIHILVNNAGVVFGGAFLDVPLEKHLQTYRVNTLGLVAMTHAFLPDLIGQPSAHLVNIASASGFVGLPYGSSYASSKWSVIGFSESIRLELDHLGHHHVGVSTICPSYVDTGLFDGVQPPKLTRLLTSEQLADRIVSGVVRDKPFVITPAVVNTAPMLRGLVPTSVLDRVAKWFGVSTSMLSWKGHGSSATAPSEPEPETADTHSA